MRCINRKRRRRRNRQRKITWLLPVLVVLLICSAGAFYLLHNQVSIVAYEKENYSVAMYTEPLVVDSLCVSTDNVESTHFSTEDELHAALLFRLDTAEVEYAENIHEKLYPASTTKILTAYLALKYGNLSDVVTISKNAVGVPLDSSRAGFKTGDSLTLEELLYSLMLPSGNDSAVAIAEYISGSEEEFAKLMNEEARKLGATNSHFVNAHGYQDEDHYTTAYDLYLILKECVKNETFLSIVSAIEFPIKLNQENGTYRDITWKQSNQYVNGARPEPDGIDVIGGKTGTTNEAGACLVLYSETEAHPYISIVMGADNKSILYENMTGLITAAVNSEKQ